MTVTLRGPERTPERTEHTPDPAPPDRRCVVVCDPGPGTVVQLAAGAQLGLRFRRHLGSSSWHVAELPGHLIQLAEDGHELVFLVFRGSEAPAPLRLERRHPDLGTVHEVCELMVVPVRAAGARTPRSS